MKSPGLIKIIICLFSLGCILCTAQSQSLDSIERNRIVLPNQWGITPVGKSLPLGDLPLNMVISNSGKLIAVTNNGESDQSIMLLDAVHQILLDSFSIRKSWLGLVFSKNEKSLFVSGGNDNWIIHFDVSHRTLVPVDTIRLGQPWPAQISPTGLAYDDENNVLYVVTKENHSLYRLDLNQKNSYSRYSIPAEGYTCLLSPDATMLYITCWGCDRVELFDTKRRKMTGHIDVGDNPNDMCQTKNGRYIFVANANDNSVSVIDVNTRKVIETLNAALFPNSLVGSTTNSVALSKDDKTLFIANADNNCLAVFDVSHTGSSMSKGFIPTGWYPTCVRVADDRIFVSNGKGFSSLANPNGPSPYDVKHKVLFQKGGQLIAKHEQYIARLFRGTLSVIPIPNDSQFSVYSQAVYHNTPYSKTLEKEVEGEEGNPIPRNIGGRSPIKYVFYIIKENRTYDQILGDLPMGNGDTSLVLFGDKITPNQHALAKEFVLFDNFYVDGEVSADGHNWCMGAYATDYLEKTWPSSYSDRGGFYDAEGNRTIANNKNGFIWDVCKKYHVSYRTYGEFAENYRPNIPVLTDHFCPYYSSWDQSVKDITRKDQWKNDFDSLLARHAVPRLNTLRFINDHTQGLQIGALSPSAQVADNDQAVGLFVDYLSHSSIWNESVVFIVEDDAQNGPDHVDAHRSTMFVAGGMVKRNFIDHTMYSTSSVLRTIELILGLPPMTQYDASAMPLWRSFTSVLNGNPFNALPPETDLNQKNTAMNEWQKKSEHFNFKKEDLVPDAELNAVLWYAQKGNSSPCPAPVHAAFFSPSKNSGDEK